MPLYRPNLINLYRYFYFVFIDECSDNTHDCHINADCTNTDGSFTCACKSGYSGDGKASCAKPLLEHEMTTASGITYQLHTATSVTWHQADRQCRSYGIELVSVNSEEENDVLLQFLQA